MQAKVQVSTPGILLPDRCMVDLQRAAMFESIGQDRSPFARLSSWSWLEQSLLSASAELLEQVGKDEWAQQTGGEYLQGRPYCRLRSPLAQRVVAELAARDGGLLWRDQHHEEWAVRLFPSRLCDEWIGVSVTLPRHDGATLAAVPGPLRLASRAEQFLWLLHAQVLAQRRSAVRIADRTFANLVWGGDSSQWPRDWRREIKQTILSLGRLHFELLRIPATGWEPRLGSFTSVLAGFNDLSETLSMSGHPDACDPACGWYDSGIPHGHFLLHTGPDFLGAMEGFAVSEDAQGVRQYDFVEQRRAAPENLTNYRKAGGLPSVHLPARLLGPAIWARLSPQLRRVLHGVLAEVTRASRSRRTDRAAIIHGAQVPLPGSRDSTICPLLDPHEKYVAFNGNGRLRGQGYRLIGEYGTGWLYKCGFDLDSELTGVGKSLRALLAQLGQLVEQFGFRVAAIDRQRGEWLDLPTLRAIARSQLGWEQLDALLLRVYAPADYDSILRNYFAVAGGFHSLPSPTQLVPTLPKAELATRVLKMGLRQAELARELDCSQPFLSSVLNGRKPWPPALKQGLERVLQAAEAKCARL